MIRDICQAVIVRTVNWITVHFNKGNCNRRTSRIYRLIKPKCFSHLFINTFSFSFSEKLYKQVLEMQQKSNRVPLCINPSSAAFKNFARYEQHSWKWIFKEHLRRKGTLAEPHFSIKTTSDQRALQSRIPDILVASEISPRQKQGQLWRALRFHCVLA